MTAPTTPRRYRFAPLIAAGLAGAFALGSWHGAYRARAMDEWADAQLLSTAIDSVRANAIDSLGSDELIRRAVAGMLRELQDPYAALLRPDSFERYRGTMRGEGHGMGLVLRREPDGAGVVRVVPGSPAHKAGVRAGDRIVLVDTVAVREAWSGKPGDTTRTFGDSSVLTLRRAPFDDTLHLTIRRAAWHMPAVTEQGVLADAVGYVRLETFTAHAADELEEAVDALRRRGATSLIVDLRGNTGGLFEEGVKSAGLFLPRGLVVASLAGRGGAPPQAHESRHSRWPSLPLAVLVDASTASAAEVMAAALHDYNRALLVGTTTYGKGVVQRVVTLSKDLSVRLTTARWLTPKGISLQRHTGNGALATGGLHPDVLLEDAARRDLFAVPRDWTPAATALVTHAADSAAMVALRAKWSAAPVPQLEARLRETLTGHAPRTVRDARARAEWVSLATRLALVRVLEVERQGESLLRYAIRHDAALRAGIDVVAPGTAVLTSTVTAPWVAPTQARMPAAAAPTENRGVRSVDAWLVSRFPAMQLLHDTLPITALAASDSVLPRIEATRAGRRADTLYAMSFGTGRGSPALPVNAMVQLAEPGGATTPLTGRVVARRAFRVPKRPGAPFPAEAAWAYGWSYVVVLPHALPVSAGSTPGVLAARHRGWLLQAVPVPVSAARAVPH